MGPVILIVGGVLAAAVLIYIALLFVTAPAPGSPELIERLKPFVSVCFAHKGLYKKDQSVPENSMPAFKAALEHGYGIDCDVQRTWDGQAVCFCASHMRTACGIDERMTSFNYEHLQKLKLYGTEESMPLLSEALELIDGRAPMIIEIKAAGRHMTAETCAVIRDALKDYSGPYCIASFDPHVLKWFRVHAPEVLRMQASMSYFSWRESDRNILRCLIMSRLFCNVISRPHIIAFEIGRTNLGFKLALKSGAPLIMFTSDKRHMHAELLKRCDSLIFEDYLPPALTGSEMSARKMD